MSKKRSYKRQSVNKVDREWLRDRAIGCGDSGTSVGLDVAKEEIVVCLRWADGWFERPWSVKNPTEIHLLIELLLLLKEICGSLTIGMESTGTYGDAVRRAMTEASLEVHRISGKSVSDYKEIFDGVPSQHDGKDAAMIAELTCFASEAISALKEMQACKKQLEEIASQHADMKKYVEVVGAVTLCVIWATVGDPRQYGSSGACLKALGLNLKEVSSGNRSGLWFLPEAVSYSHRHLRQVK